MKNEPLQFLGTLCRRGHEFKTTGKSARWRKGNHCVECKKLVVAAYAKKQRDREFAETTVGVVACAICGVRRRCLDGHLRAEHGLSAAQYRLDFPGTVTEVAGSRARSPACRVQQSISAKGRWSKTSEREAQSARMKESAPWKGKHLSAEHRAAISAGGQGVSHEMTPEGRRAIGDNGRRVLEKIRKHPGYSAKLAAGVQRRIARGEKIGLMREDVQAKSLASRIRNGTLVPPGGGRGICGWRRDLSHYCRSTLEANFARVLVLEEVPYDHEPRLFRLPSGRHYLPDFYLHRPWRGIPAGWVELRGWRNLDGSLAGDRNSKIKEFEDMERVSVFVLAQTDDLWKEIRSVFKPRIALWERPRKNLKTHPEIFGVSKTA